MFFVKKSLYSTSILILVSLIHCWSNIKVVRIIDFSIPRLLTGLNSGKFTECIDIINPAHESQLLLRTYKNLLNPNIAIFEIEPAIITKGSEIRINQYLYINTSLRFQYSSIAKISPNNKPLSDGSYSVALVVEKPGKAYMLDSYCPPQIVVPKPIRVFGPQLASRLESGITPEADTTEKKDGNPPSGREPFACDDDERFQDARTNYDLV